MSEPNATDSDPTLNTDQGNSKIMDASESLEHLAERLRAAQSVWTVLAPSCLSSTGREIVEAGRAAHQEIETLSQRSGGPDDTGALRASARIDGLETSICGVAFAIPIAQLRATLPTFLRSNRRGLLDLLDMLAGDAYESGEQLASKLGAIDYLITLLCTNGNAQQSTLPHDPVMLTPCFEMICQRAEAEGEARLPEIEAEFFAAANLEEDLHDEIQRRGLRARKAKLGKSYFAPSMLRAIITYNVALMQCAEAKVWDSRDWGGRCRIYFGHIQCVGLRIRAPPIASRGSSPSATRWGPRYEPDQPGRLGAGSRLSERWR